MSDAWQEAITAAERALGGDERALPRVVHSVGTLCTDPLLHRHATAGRNAAYLLSLLDALGQYDASRTLVQRLASCVAGDPRLVNLDEAVSRQLAVTLADRGHLAAAEGLLTACPGSAATLVNLASVALRQGRISGAADFAVRARHLAGDEETEERLDIRLLATAILADAARRRGRNTEADQLVTELEGATRTLVHLLGSDHPKSLSALVALASAEFGSARAAGERERMDRAAHVLAVAAQRMSATLGTHHPRSLSALRTLATVEYQTAEALGDDRRLQGAVALLRAAARRAAERRDLPRPDDVGPAGARRAMPVGRPGDGPRVPNERRPRGPDVPGAEKPAALRFGVLGPVRAWRGDEPLSTGSPQQRAVLAALLLRGGRSASAAELIEALWGDEPPSQALAAVRTYASRLRRVLGADVLVSTSGGYALQGLRDRALDLTVTRDLAGAAEKAQRAGDLSHAREVLRRALAQWEGEALAGVPGPYAEAQRVRLQEWHLQLLESRLDMDLEQGCHVEAVPELTALTAAHPLRERLRELLMLALYRSGRQAEALAVYADSRRLLAEELGVDPRPGMRELRQRILQADARLAEPSAPVAEPTVAPVRPAQLPATVPDFTGRGSYVSDLTHVLAASVSSQEGRVMAVSALGGIGGVGKTTLAVHVAHGARPAFPHGQLYVDLQGSGPRPAEPETVLGVFLRALGTPDSAIPDSLEERAALYRSVLDGRRVLVLLDNARDAAQVRPLLPGAGGCAALVTSRVRMVDLAGAHLVDLDVMSPQEALQLFTSIVGEERVAVERGAALDVVAACGFLPLAIRIAGSRLAARRGWAVSDLAERLADERHRLDELQAGDLAVKATFELGYKQLEPAQARAFRLLGLADGPDVSLAAAAAVLNLPVGETEDLLESLVDASTLESPAPGRYRFHDLMRLYARVCADQDEPPGERDAALSRLLDFYWSAAVRVRAVTRPGSRPTGSASPWAEHPGPRFDSGSGASDWLETEAASLLACVRQSAEIGRVRRGAELLLAADDLIESAAGSHQYETTARVMCRAARAAGDVLAEGRARAVLAEAFLYSGRLREAEEEARLAGELAESVRDDAAVSRAAGSLGLVRLHQGRYAESRRCLERAIEGFRATGDRSSEATALCNLSRVLLVMGDTEPAVAAAQHGLALHSASGDTVRLAAGHHALGVALSRAGRHVDALDAFIRALGIFSDHRRTRWQGSTHLRIAETHLAAGSPAEAARHAEKALALGCVGGDRARANVLTLLGRALSQMGQQDRAKACWHEALHLYEQEGGAAETDEVRALLTAAAA